MKLCSGCNTLKDESAFGKCSRDGLQYKCKDCNKIYNNSKEHKSKLREYEKTSKHKARKRAYETSEERKVIEKFRYHNTPGVKERHRNYALSKNYGITIEDFDYLLSIQNGYCAICKLDPSIDKKKFSVDHCHSNKEFKKLDKIEKRRQIRGILCRLCNLSIGFFKDDINLLKFAIEYLIKPPINGILKSNARNQRPEILAIFKNICSICSSENNLFIDHCHSTGLIRGILCRECNSGLGHFKDLLERIIAAIEYLQKEKPFRD